MNDTATAPALTPEKLLATTWAHYGRVTIGCDCGALEFVVDGGALNNFDDVDREAAARLLEHARYAHSGPRAIIATLHATVVDLAAEVTR